MTQHTSSIVETLQSANPLHDPDFVKQLHIASLTYDDYDTVPRRVAQLRQIRDLWMLVGEKDVSPAFDARFTHAALPNFHAILAEALHCAVTGEHPNFIDLRDRALRTLRVLLRQRVKEIGFEATCDELRDNFLQAAAQVAEAGFTPQALGSMAMIFGLTRLDREMRYLI